MAICWKLRVSYLGNEVSADNQQGRPANWREPSETTRHAPLLQRVKI